MKASTAPYKAKCLESHADRWSYGHSDFAAAAYVLDPEFHEHDTSANEEVTTGFMNIVEKIGILKVVREKLETFDKAFKARYDFLGDDPSKLASFDAFPTYPTSETDTVQAFCVKVSSQLALYRGKKGIFGRTWVMQGARNIPAYLWWDSNGSSCVDLQYVARMVLAQPASASICERINSEFAFVKDPRRNRLSHTNVTQMLTSWSRFSITFAF